MRHFLFKKNGGVRNRGVAGFESPITKIRWGPYGLAGKGLGLTNLWNFRSVKVD